MTFTPFDIAVSTKTNPITEPTLPMFNQLMSRMSEMCSLATVWPLVLAT